MAAIDKQNAEFDALTELSKRWSELRNVAVVDDDYPEARHRYEGALRDFIRAIGENGRLQGGKGKQMRNQFEFEPMAETRHEAAALLRRCLQLMDTAGESDRSMRSHFATAAFRLLHDEGPEQEAEFRKCDADPVGYLREIRTRE